MAIALYDYIGELASTYVGNKRVSLTDLKAVICSRFTYIDHTIDLMAIRSILVSASRYWENKNFSVAFAIAQVFSDDSERDSARQRTAHQINNSSKIAMYVYIGEFASTFVGRKPRIKISMNALKGILHSEFATIDYNMELSAIVSIVEAASNYWQKKNPSLQLAIAEVFYDESKTHR
jgi:hypothetical protein